METEVNWAIVIPVVVASVILIIYLIVRNQKDEKQFEKSENTVIEDDSKNDSY